MDRKPLASMQSKVARSFRLQPLIEEELRAEALLEGIGWTTVARECLIEGLSMKKARRSLLSHTRVTA